MAGLVAFRLVWGLVGTRHARFANFVRGPAAVLRYVRSLAGGHHEDHVGHNPLGALGIVALLGLTVAVAATGWAVFEQIGGDWLEEAHELAANTMLAVVGVHIAGVALASWMTHTNLVSAMVTGRKLAPPSEAIASAWRSVAAVMVVAVMGFWWLQWQSAPTAGEAAAQTATATAVGDRHRGRAKD
jgi:cytochrome b